MKSPLEAQGNVPIFELSYGGIERAELHAGLDRILDRAYLTNDRYVALFEREFADFLGNGIRTIAVASGTAALEVACRALRLEGKAVLLPTNTFIASAVAIKNSGAVPVPFDIDSERGIEIAELERSLTADVAAVMIVHIGGRIQSDLGRIIDWCRARGLRVIEDCAHAHGSSLGGVSAGAFGDIGAYSFHLTKTMTAGEGGMVVTRDESLAAFSRRLRRFGETDENGLRFDSWGGNFKMTELQALMGLVDLARAGHRIARRRAIHALYRDRLRDLTDPLVLTQTEGTCGYYKTILRSTRGRAFFERTLKAHGIPLTGGVYYFPLHAQPVMRSIVGDRAFPKADAFAAEHFCPPCFPELTDEQVGFVCDVVGEAARG